MVGVQGYGTFQRRNEGRAAELAVEGDVSTDECAER